jgi:hypothetical protein
VHIFIDESGTFTGVGADAPAVSTLGALIMPSHRLPKLFKKYSRLRANLPTRQGEVKGRLLDERQVAAVIEILRINGALFCASMIDLADHTAEDIAQHRARAARVSPPTSPMAIPRSCGTASPPCRRVWPGFRTSSTSRAR